MRRVFNLVKEVTHYIFSAHRKSVETRYAQYLTIRKIGRINNFKTTPLNTFYIVRLGFRKSAMPNRAGVFKYGSDYGAINDQYFMRR